MGDTVYFLNFNHEIVKGTVSKIDATTVVYKDSYTGEQKSYSNIQYCIHTNYPDNQRCDENNLYSTPEEIVAMFNDQIEQGDFD